MPHLLAIQIMEFLGPFSFVLLALFGALLFLLASARLRRLEAHSEEVESGLASMLSEVQRWQASMQRFEVALEQERHNLEDHMRRERNASEQRVERSLEELAGRIAEQLRTVEWHEDPSTDAVAKSDAQATDLAHSLATLTQELEALKTAVHGARDAAAAARESAERTALESNTLKGEFERLATAQERVADSRVTITRLVTEHLEAQGFDRVTLFGDLEPRHPEDTQRVRVEAFRRDAAWKGSVSVRNGRVVDVSLQPSYSMFP